jgi:hypothetical protein
VAASPHKTLCRASACACASRLAAGLYVPFVTHGPLLVPSAVTIAKMDGTENEHPDVDVKVGVASITGRAGLDTAAEPGQRWRMSVPWEWLNAQAPALTVHGTGAW